MPLVTSGVDHGNLRELALARMKDHGAHVSLNISIMNNCCTVQCVCIFFFAEYKLERNNHIPSHFQWEPHITTVFTSCTTCIWHFLIPSPSWLLNKQPCKTAEWALPLVLIYFWFSLIDFFEQACLFSSSSVEMYVQEKLEFKKFTTKSGPTRYTLYLHMSEPHCRFVIKKVWCSLDGLVIQRKI